MGYYASGYLNPYVCYVFGNLLHWYKNETLAFSYYMTGAERGEKDRKRKELEAAGRYFTSLDDYSYNVLFKLFYAVGQMYENGEGTDIDLDKALEYYRRAAGHGMAEAQIAMALLVQKIYPGEEGHSKAMALYAALDDTDKFSSPESSLSAQEIWGLRYENGYGVEQSGEKAVECYEKAVESGERSI